MALWQVYLESMLDQAIECLFKLLDVFGVGSRMKEQTIHADSDVKKPMHHGCNESLEAGRGPIVSIWCSNPLKFALAWNCEGHILACVWMEQLLPEGIGEIQHCKKLCYWLGPISPMHLV